MPSHPAAFLQGSSSSYPSTASGLLALLKEPDPTLQLYALRQLLQCVDAYWHEIAECLVDLEALAEGVVTSTTGGDDSTASTALQQQDNEQVRRLAAAVASRVFYALEEPQHALRLALVAGEQYFSPLANTPYEQQLVAAALDAYVSLQQRREDDNVNDAMDLDHKDGSSTKATPSSTAGAVPAAQLQAMVHRLIAVACDNGQWESALGVALEAREMDQVQWILTTHPSSWKYALHATLRVVDRALVRRQALQLVAKTLQQQFEGAPTTATSPQQQLEVAPDLVQVYQLLNQPSNVATVLTTLLNRPTTASEKSNNTNDDHPAGLLALQLCFDLMDSGAQAFCQAVAGQLFPPSSPNPAGPVVVAVTEGTTVDGSTTTTAGSNTAPPTVPSTTTTTTSTSSSLWWSQAQKVLQGGFASELALSFLHKRSAADKFVVEQLRKALEERSSRSSILHHAAIVAHGYLYAGTTNDAFLRDHLDWMKKATNWYVACRAPRTPPGVCPLSVRTWSVFVSLPLSLSLSLSLSLTHTSTLPPTHLPLCRAKFSATATLGVIHSMHITEAKHLLGPYLPPDDNPTPSASGGYAEGGSLYALGLIHAQASSCATQRLETCHYLRRHLRQSHVNEVLSHGAALGVGLTAMGTADPIILHELKELLDTDSAVAGEAAGIAMGLVLVGTGAGNVHHSLGTAHAEEIQEIVMELKNYARETQHEKIIRGLAIGLALMNYGQEEHADGAIEEMRRDRDPIMRYGAQYALALAYCGTGSNRAIRILLHTAVSDVSDDVRMAAVIGLAFVLYKTPDRVPQLVKLLLESFNPHVRYASCIAVGIAMAGSGDPDSVALLEPMLDDMTDYVRQGALIGTAMIYMQQSDACNNRKVKSFRDRLASTVAEKHQSTMTKLGAVLATGLLDAGGRNCSLSLGSRNGFTKMSSAAGMVLWLQHWHWYPMMNMLSLVLTPTCTIGLNREFKYPKKFEIICNAKPSAFAYPKKLEEKKEEKKKRVETVTLSTTAKEKARLARKRAKMGDKDATGNAMEVDKDGGVASDGAAGDGKTADATEDQDKDSEAMEVDKDETPKATDDEDADAVKPKKKREPEPTSFRVGNPSRITASQSLVCEFDLNQRYRPIRPNEKPVGVIILTDCQPEELEEDMGTVKSPALEPEGEMAPPEPFEWTPPIPPPAPTAASSSSSAE